MFCMIVFIHFLFMIIQYIWNYVHHLNITEGLDF